MLNSKNALSQKYTQPQKRTLWNSAKKIQKKFTKKKFQKKSPEKNQKKIEERLPNFSRSQIGEGGYRLIHLRNGRYAPIHLHRHRDRRKDREV